MAVLTVEKVVLSREGGMSARERRTVFPVWLEAKQWYSGKEIASEGGKISERFDIAGEGGVPCIPVQKVRISNSTSAKSVDRTCSKRCCFTVEANGCCCVFWVLVEAFDSKTGWYI